MDNQKTPSYPDKQAESPTSRFTAVNGREPSSAGSANGENLIRRSPEERGNGQPRISPPGQEKLTITTTGTSREDWSHTNGRPTVGYPQPPAAYHESESSHKRKRSGSLDRAQNSSTGSYHSHGLPTPKPSHDPVAETPDTAREAPYTQYGDEARENGAQGGLWYPQPAHDSQMSNETPHSAISHPPSEEQVLRDALERNNNQSMEPQTPYPATSPGEDTGATPQYPNTYATNREGLQMQADHKKRKRNFSNRTKTGCMTCRKRKKKCDETRPECNNCIRGGFVCNGYPQRGQWTKTEQKTAPVPLQSKDGYEASANPYVSAPTYPSLLNQQKREPLPSYRGQPLRVDPQQGPARPLMDDDRPSATSTLPSASVGSPENRLSAISYTANAFPTPTSAANPNYPERLPPTEYKRVPPLHDMSRQEHEVPTPQSAQPPSSALPHINILHPNHGGSPQSLTPQPNPQDAARLALSHPASSSTTRPRTQKEEMLAGKNYFPFDKELVLERERCNGACWRFNSSTNPNNGVSPEERARLFRDILQPRDHVNISPTNASPITPVGRVGDNVVVEAPFHCDYGYNISIGQDVSIGKNCTILDTCEVRIGDRCIIGPNVNIYTATLPVDPKRRLGSRGPSLGKGIVIEEDCWIGGGVTILPGRTIKRGSTVGAGSIVTRDVPPFTVVCGNPARVIRGLYEHHNYAPHD